MKSKNKYFKKKFGQVANRAICHAYLAQMSFPQMSLHANVTQPSKLPQLNAKSDAENGRVNVCYRFRSSDENFGPSEGVFAGGNRQIPEKAGHAVDATAAVPVRPETDAKNGDNGKNDVGIFGAYGLN